MSTSSTPYSAPSPFPFDLPEKRRTLRQTLQRQRQEQAGSNTVSTKFVTPEGNGTTMGEGHHQGHRLSYTEATGSKLYTPPPYPMCRPPPGSTRSITINNPAYAGENQDDNLV